MAKRCKIARIIGDNGLRGKQLRGKANYEQGVNLIGIGVHKGKPRHRRAQGVKALVKLQPS